MIVRMFEIDTMQQLKLIRGGGAVDEPVIRSFSTAS
jgi:hypothetical protein